MIAEAQIRKEEMDRELTLRTQVSAWCQPPVSQCEQAMRDSEKKGRRRYCFTVLRIRMPDGHVIQGSLSCCMAGFSSQPPGTFAAGETVQKVYEYVQSFLANPQAEFTLLLPSASQHFNDFTKRLVDVGLVPSTLIHCQPAEGAQLSLSLDAGMVEKHSIK